MACTEHGCSINHGHKHDHKPRPSLIRVASRPQVVTKTVHHHDNCGVCHEHKKLEDNGIAPITKKLHAHDHACHDHTCSEHGTPHGHIVQPETHKHDHKCNHHHHEAKPQHNTLETIVANSTMPQWFKELVLNTSFLTPAFFTNYILKAAPLPKLIKTWLAVTAMHITNRGNSKLGRLGLTYLASGLASFDRSLKGDSPYKFNLTRFLATSCIALIEKFAGDHKPNLKKSGYDNAISEIKTISSNLTKPNKWRELIPSLLNIEAKVQLVAPTVSYIVSKLPGKNTSRFVKTALQALLISVSFVGSDAILRLLGKSLGQESLASAVGAMCGCCGSPVCAAAATDSAVSNSF